jgi:hypothetical protein
MPVFDLSFYMEIVLIKNNACECAALFLKWSSRELKSIFLTIVWLAVQDMDGQPVDKSVVKIGDILTHIDGVSLARCPSRLLPSKSCLYKVAAGIHVNAGSVHRDNADCDLIAASTRHSMVWSWERKAQV